MILLNVLLQVSSFILVKFAAVSASTYLNIFFNLYYLFALLLLVLRALVWQLVLKRKDISMVYPLNSVVPVLILLASVMLFNESLTMNNALGTLVLFLGIFLVLDR